MVDPRGAVAPVGDAWTLDWWLGADDRWRVPAREPAVRQGSVEGTPVAETRARVPGGDAVERVYGIGGPGDVVVVEVANDSPAAFVVGFVVRGATTIALDGSQVSIDGRVALVLPFAPPRWDVTDLAVEPEACGAETGPVPARSFAPGTLQAVFLFPLSHRNRMRVAVVTGVERPVVDLAQVPSPESVVRGWHAHLAAGMRVVGPAEITTPVDLARSQVVLDPDPGPAAAAALEDWGFDEQAEWAWHGLSLRERRAARRRVRLRDDDGPAGLLLRTREQLVAEADDGLDLLREPPARGVDLEVHDAPTRHGRLSFALRWHGEHPALLWELAEARGEVELRAPTLAPGWSTRTPVGETLLRPTAA